MASSSKKKVSGRLRSQQFDQNINRRGKVAKAEKTEKSPFGPVVIGFFLFVVVGSGQTQPHSHSPNCTDTTSPHSRSRTETEGASATHTPQHRQP